MGHEFIFAKNNYEEDNHIERYICSKCNADIDKFEDGKIFMWIKNAYGNVCDYVSLISCEEKIIKDIIE